MSPTSDQFDVTNLADRLCQLIESYESVAIAFSGGVDSAVVAKASQLALGDRSVAVTGIGPALSTTEYRDAVETANAIGIRHAEVVADELSDPGYVANEGRRCYFCKSRLYEATTAYALEHEINVIANGTNADDLGDYRPGLEAAAEQNVRSPLVELGINKASVRALARHWKLDVSTKPASPCLASRIAPGIEVTSERLERIEAAEAVVAEVTGLRELRVRLEAGELARIEVPQTELATAFALLHEHDVLSRLKTLGFRAVTLDFAGFHSGSLNALVSLDTARTAD